MIDTIIDILDFLMDIFELIFDRTLKNKYKREKGDN